MKTKKIKRLLALVMSVSMMVGGMLTATAADNSEANQAEVTIAGEETTTTPATTAVPEGYYKSELTNELTPVLVQNQRPIAVMVDNEITALPHFGVNQADIVYEMVNSTANGRITRLMCIFKNWQNITQLGSVRSTRPTNFMIAAEYNAILCHDGGPYYNNQYIKQPYTNNLSGGFARFSNGKRAEFTEYITLNGYKNPKTGKSYAGLVQRIAAAGYSTTYNDYSLYKSTPHFNFSDAEITLDGKPGVISGVEVDLPFPHNSSKLYYNATTRTYDYYDYNKPHIDEIDKKITSFKNVLIMNAEMCQLDAHGYMVYGVLAANRPGFFLTNGKAIPVTWSKAAEIYKTEFFEATGAPVTLNTGKTYIAIVPADAWAQLVIK